MATYTVTFGGVIDPPPIDRDVRGVCLLLTDETGWSREVHALVPALEIHTVGAGTHSWDSIWMTAARVAADHLAFDIRDGLDVNEFPDDYFVPVALQAVKGRADQLGPDVYAGGDVVLAFEG